MIVNDNAFKFTLYLFMCLLVVIGCQQPSISNADESSKLFTILSPESTGLNFINKLEETTESNYYQYLYTYIGGGVAAGDINNDGLIDLYFSSNASEDKLFLNKGNFHFEDITVSAGVLLNDGFNTGVTMVDINADGYLDIYVSRGGWKEDNNKFNNLLYINNGNLTFSEQAAVHGLDDSNRTIHVSFFDYDRDNDLDVYIANAPNVTGRSKTAKIAEIQKDPEMLKLKGSDRFYENDGTGHFTDVSEQAGLQYDKGFGLNPQVADLNDDGWLDVYVCNDFNYPDLVYINNGDKTFTESRDQLFKHMSFNSMGSDVADINNDGLFDLMTLDMNPEDYIRSKTTMSMTSISRFESMVQNGYHRQYMHNMLQLNNGNGTYREVANMAGIANTDWSWSLLSADFNLNGLNDLYITNGVYRDVLNQDKNREIKSILRKNNRKPTKEDLLQFTKMLPQQKLRNYFFQNNANLTFSDKSTEWASELPTFSNGATYADLDNDGDLDIVVNNINDPATILKNGAVENEMGHFVKIKLKGPKGNASGVGAKLTLHLKDGSSQIRQHISTRGYLSSVANEVHFGFEKSTPENLEITWSDGTQQTITKLSIDQQLEVSYDSKKPKKQKANESTYFVKGESIHMHKDPYFNDFNLQILLPHKLSQLGPFAAKTDVNGDGNMDLFIGGGHQQAGQLLLGKINGEFTKVETSAFTKDAYYEDQGAVFFDADNDGDEDLYVVSGSYEFFNKPIALQDRLYFNDGKGKFEKLEGRLPMMKSAGSVVIALDYDNDGDLDLFVGGRVVPGKYPYAPDSYLLQNNKGSFVDVTNEVAPEIQQIGMVTDASWSDLDKDGVAELIITGEWMGIEVFTNEDGKLQRNDRYNYLSKMKGWWNKILIADIDNDGDNDIIAGNLGLNSKFHASSEKPFQIYAKDFDSNGVEDILLAKEYNGKEVPIRGKTCMTQQMPYLANRIKSYDDFANADLEQIIGTDLSKALNLEVVEFKSGIFINQGQHSFAFEPLAQVAQTAPINSILFQDFDGDQKVDLLVAGNNYQSEVETTRSDAGISTFFKGNEVGGFDEVPNKITGLFLDQDVRDIEVLNFKNTKLILVINNNDSHRWYTLKK